MKTARTLGWCVVVAGVWEALAPFILGFSSIPAALWNAMIVGIVLIVLAVIAVYSQKSGTVKAMEWINACLGLWLVLAPFILGYTAGPRANDITVGIIVIVLAVWAALVAGNE
ncbi:MAG: SPW repeat protein [Chloroflexi bacterium]|nr:SPW repeat protein [Chloroflexota bacterium]